MCKSHRISAALLALSLLAVLPAAARVIQIEAETFDARHNEGEDSFMMGQCPGGVIFLFGLDHPGDYLEYEVELEAGAWWVDSLRTSGEQDLVRAFVVSFVPADGGDAVDTEPMVTAPGVGYG